MPSVLVPCVCHVSALSSIFVSANFLWIISEIGQICSSFASCTRHSLKITLWCLWIDCHLSPLTQYLNLLSIETWNNSLTIVFRLSELVCFMSNFGFRVLHTCPVWSIVFLNLNTLVFKDGLNWHEPLREFSCLLLPIVLRRKWLIVLNCSDVSNGCCSDLLILSSL